MAFWRIDPPWDEKRQYENAAVTTTLKQVNESKKGRVHKIQDNLIKYAFKTSRTEDVAAKLKGWLSFFRKKEE